MDHVWGSAPVPDYWDALVPFLPLDAAAVVHLAFRAFDLETSGGESLYYMFLRASLHGPWLVDQHNLRGSWKAVYDAFAASGALSSTGPVFLPLGPASIPATLRAYRSGEKQAVLLAPGCAQVGDLLTVDLKSLPLRAQVSLRSLPEPRIFSLPLGAGARSSGLGALCYLLTVDDDNMPYGHYHASGHTPKAMPSEARCVAQVLSFFALKGDVTASPQPHGSSWTWQPCGYSHTGWMRADHLRLPRLRAPVAVLPREPGPPRMNLWHRRIDNTRLRAWVIRTLVPASTPPSSPGPPRKRLKGRATAIRGRLADLGRKSDWRKPE